LQEFYLHPKQLGIAAAYALGSALRVNRTLSRIRMSAPFPHEQIRNNQIEEIDWTQKEINSCDLIVLVNLLKDNTSVRVLKLSGNDVCARGASALWELVKTSKSIIAVDLSANPGIGDDHVKELQEALKVNKTLQVLMLKGTGMGDNGAVGIATSLPKSGIRKLYLDYNRIGGLGAAKLADAVDSSPQLKELYLANNQIPMPVRAQCGADPHRVFFEAREPRRRSV
jgi:hypothetical protein